MWLRANHRRRRSKPVIKVVERRPPSIYIRTPHRRHSSSSRHRKNNVDSAVASVTVLTLRLLSAQLLVDYIDRTGGSERFWTSVVLRRDIGAISAVVFTSKP
ncbi:hypothetical protein Q1695_007351 [Nippostrongylus brasiliensis]|nr:hypothetical protein Q1695_007351 [Nippostrongylus brasiliensis]